MDEIELLPRNGCKVVSTFSGCGGSCLGYRMAGFDVIWANEFIPAAQETYRANHPETILDTRDIREVKPEDILAATGLKVGELDLFDGSPPCASFSTAGKREKLWGVVKKYSDTEQRTDDLFYEYIRLIEGLQPKTFVAENVKGLTLGAAVDLLGTPQLDMFVSQDDTFFHRMCDAGYRVEYRVLNAADYGVPQSRARTIFVGVRNDLKRKPAFPKPLPYCYSVEDAIPWIRAVGGIRKSGFGGGEMIPASQPCPTIMAGGGGGMNTSQFGVEAETDISKYAIGTEWDNIEPGEQSEKYFNLVKPDPARPCPTITQTGGCRGAAAVVHPFEKRKFSIFELKRICAFPDDFVLTGSWSQQWERLGRSVPPVFMSHIAKAVYDEILQRPF